MPASFDDRKAKILADLSTPDDQYQDLSPKGTVDAGIRELIAEINAHPDYVTTSSCAGRIAAYLEGSKGAKGGGRWLFTSHDPIELPAEPGAVYALLGLVDGSVSAPEATATSRFVHFKFEPLILHILSKDIKAAQHVASAALAAGFRESGINSILNTPAGMSATPMVAVRSSGLAFDCIIGFSTTESSGTAADEDLKIVPMVSEDYLRTLISVANQRFQTNDERRERFRKALLRH